MGCEDSGAVDNTSPQPFSRVSESTKPGGEAQSCVLKLCSLLRPSQQSKPMSCAQTRNGGLEESKGLCHGPSQSPLSNPNCKHQITNSSGLLNQVSNPARGPGKAQKFRQLTGTKRAPSSSSPCNWNPTLVH